MSTRTKRLLKSTRAMCLAGAFVLASSLSIYASETQGAASAASATLPPTFTIIDQRTPSELNIVISESEMANFVSMASGVAANGEVYVLMGRYQICALSNAIHASSGKAGFLLKIVPTSGFTATSVTNSQTQLAFRNSSNTNIKVRAILHIEPAGGTKLATAYGNDGSTSGDTQYDAGPFLIGADVAVQAEATVKLADQDASSIPSAVALKNLSTSNYGTVNHYAVAGGGVLSVSDGTNTDGGLSTSEGLTITGCTTSKTETNPAAGDADGLIDVRIYANIKDLSSTSAGTYTLSYGLHTADIDDSVGTVYDDTA